MQNSEKMNLRLMAKVQRGIDPEGSKWVSFCALDRRTWKNL